MYRKSKFPIFYGPDNGTNVAVPAGDSPTGSQIEVTPRQSPPAPEIHQAPSIAEEPKRVRQSGAKTSKLDVAKELGLDKPPSEYIADEAGRVRDEKGKFVKKDPELFAGKTEQPKPAEVPLGEPKPEAKKPDPVPAEKTEPQKVKLKIDGKEMTEEEISAQFKELREKASPPAPAKVEQTKPADPAPEPPSRMTRDQWLAAELDRNDPATSALWDKALTGDSKALRQILINREADVREYIIGNIAPVIAQQTAKIAALEGRVTPLAQTYQEQTAQQNADRFMGSHPDIKAHTNGYNVMVETAAELNDEYGAIQGLLSANPNAPFSKAYKARLDAITGDNFFTTLAQEARAKLGLNAPTVNPPPVAAAAVAQSTPAVQPKPLRPPPQPGNVGGVGAAKKVSESASQVQELMNHPKW